MKIENPEIRTNPFKKSPARKKDGLHQVKIRVFIGSTDFGKFRNKVTLEINILDETNQPVLASSSEFDNRKSNKTLNLTILKTEDKIKASYRHFLSAFSLRNIFSTVTTEFISPSSILSNVIVLGKNWLSKRKKKKKGAKASEKTDEKVSSDG